MQTHYQTVLSLSQILCIPLRREVYIRLNGRITGVIPNPLSVLSTEPVRRKLAVDREIRLQQSVFGIIHALWEILWSFENYRDTDIDYQRYDRRQFIDSSIEENIKSTTVAYKRMNTHKWKVIMYTMMYLHCIVLDMPWHWIRATHYPRKYLLYMFSRLITLTVKTGY